MVWPNDYPALATWNGHGNKTDPVWTCLWWAASVTGLVSPCTKPSAVASTALIQRILTDRCHILTDRQYTVQGLLFSAHSAHIVHNTYRYMHILADSCRYFVYVSYSYWSICRYDVGIFAVSLQYLPGICRYMSVCVGIKITEICYSHWYIHIPTIPGYTYRYFWYSFHIPSSLRYLHDTYMIPTQTLRVNIRICRYVPCRYVHVLQVYAGIGRYFYGGVGIF